MMRCSCHGLHGCVPVAPRITSNLVASSSSWRRRSTMAVAASANVSQRPVRTSISDAISSPTRWSSSGVPRAPAWSSSKRFTSPSVSGSRMANSSSTATVKSRPDSNPSRPLLICSSGLSFCVSPTGRKYQSGYAFPAPEPLRGAAGGGPPPAALPGRKGEERAELRGEVVHVPAREGGELAVLRRVLLLDPGGDLGEARVARDERRRAARRRLGRHHAESLREDGRGHAYVGERPQVRQVAVLERAREEDGAPRGRGLERGALRPEADDDRPGVHALQRREQEVDALLAAQLPSEDDRRALARQEALEPLGVPGIRV